MHGGVVVHRHTRAAHADVDVHERSDALGQRRHVLGRVDQQADARRGMPLRDEAREAAGGR